MNLSKLIEVYCEKINTLFKRFNFSLFCKPPLHFPNGECVLGEFNIHFNAILPGNSIRQCSGGRHGLFPWWNIQHAKKEYG